MKIHTNYKRCRFALVYAIVDQLSFKFQWGDFDKIKNRNKFVPGFSQ